MRYFEDYLKEAKELNRFYAPKNTNPKIGGGKYPFGVTDNLKFIESRTGVYLYDSSGGTDLNYDTPLLEITAPNIVRILKRIAELSWESPDNMSDEDRLNYIDFEMDLDAYYKVKVSNQNIHIHNTLSGESDVQFPMLKLVKYFNSRMQDRNKVYDTPDGEFSMVGISIDFGFIDSLGSQVRESLDEKKARKSPKDKETGLPKKYVSGLSDKEAKKRKEELEKKKNTKGKDRYEAPETDKGEKTKESSHTKKFREQFGDSDDLDNKSSDPIENIIELVKKKMPELDKTKLKEVVEEIKDRGAEAWVGGHRPGATQQQWYLARIYSFFTKGKTYYTTDRDQAEKLGLLEPED